MSQAQDDTHTAVTASFVASIAALSRLAVTADEAAALGPQFTSILRQFEGLAKLDLEGVAPLVSLSGADTVLRADVPEASLTADQVLANAPQRVDDFYRVPKTVGGDE